MKTIKIEPDDIRRYLSLADAVELHNILAKLERAKMDGDA